MNDCRYDCRCPGCGHCKEAATLREIRNDLIAWANEGDRSGGTTAYGPLFTRAMKAAQKVRKLYAKNKTRG